MITVSDNPALWPTVNLYRRYSYFVVAAFVVLLYDWALTFGQAVELVWRQSWSLMTFLYLGVHYLGILYAALGVLDSAPTISLTDTVSLILYVVRDWTGYLTFAMLWVIIIARLYAMYQESRKILITLIVTFLAVSIFNGANTVRMTIHTSGEALVLSSTYQCSIGYPEYLLFLYSISWILCIAWEALTLSLAVWIAVKHFRELRLYSAGGIIKDCFTVLIRSHVVYFASFVAVSCLRLITNFSPHRSTGHIFLETQTYYGLLQLLELMQMFVLGPRLILSIREYHARLMADHDAINDMVSIALQERVHISTGNGV
ncbi:hypothetical protein BDR07DRAFT_1013882 [Suillus spraguei]|nr:hypothetical protein BDR07DRAFT_1013882 [Suillus spraguei]